MTYNAGCQHKPPSRFWMQAVRSNSLLYAFGGGRWLKIVSDCAQASSPIQVGSKDTNIINTFNLNYDSESPSPSPAHLLCKQLNGHSKNLIIKMSFYLMEMCQTYIYPPRILGNFWAQFSDNLSWIFVNEISQVFWCQRLWLETNRWFHVSNLGLVMNFSFMFTSVSYVSKKKLWLWMLKCERLILLYYTIVNYTIMSYKTVDGHN